MSKSDPAIQTIEQLKQRFQEMNDQKVRLQTHKEIAEKKLQDLKQQAVDQFGTDDLAKLQAMLQDLKHRNETEKAEYQKRLDEIDRNLQQIDASLRDESPE